jgi:hypothetical protein
MRAYFSINPRLHIYRNDSAAEAVMTSRAFGHTVVDPVSCARPGQQRLRRRASAPELADMRTMRDNTQQIYDSGNKLRLQLNGRSIQKQGSVW